MLSPIARILSALPLLLSASVITAAAQVSVSQYGSLPLSFEANQGQAEPSVRYLSHSQSYTLFLERGESVIVPQATTGTVSPIRIRLANTNSNATPTAEEQQLTRTNYFLGNNPAKWQTNIPNYSRIRYNSIYPGIDLVYYGNQRHLEHDFIVAPHADPDRIVLTIEGTKQLHIDANTRDLILSKNNRTSLRLRAPVTYQENNGARIPIRSSYKLLPNHRVSFEVGPYNHSRPLIIDPVLVYSTYLGGSGSSVNGDQGNGIAVDADGNAYIVGTTYSANFPITTGTFQETSNASAGLSTVFVSKLNAAGTALIYSTYLGGSGGDSGYGIALDQNRNAYITGATYSTDFPVTCGAFQVANPTTASGASTAFVAKLNAAGDGLAYSTYLGGSGNHANTAQGDVAQAIAVNSNGNSYVTGYTYSADFPLTPGTFRTQLSAQPDIFATELSPDGTALVYSTYLGGQGFGNAIAIDSSGDAFVAGSTSDPNFPVTSGAFQTSNNAFQYGAPTAFVTELNPTGTDEVYSTYLGGSWGESAQAIAVDKNGFAYVTGTTNSPDFPLTSDVLEPSSNFPGSPAAFVTKLNATGTAMEYSTFLEGQSTTISGLAVDNMGAAYIVGNATTSNAGKFGGFISTPDALPTPESSGNSAFILKLDPSAAFLNYATLLGGSANDAAIGVALDLSGSAYAVGYANSADFTVTSGALQTAKGATAGSNAFVAKFDSASESNQTQYPVGIALIPTWISAYSQITNVQCPSEFGFNSYDVCFGFGFLPEAAGPPPTGTIVFDGEPIDGPFPAYPDNFGINLCYNLNIAPASGPIVDSHTATYSGDSNYLPSSSTYTATDPGCPAGSVSGSVKKSIKSPPVPSLNRPLTLRSLRDKSITGRVMPKLFTIGPKFVPLPAVPHGTRKASSAFPSMKSLDTVGCIAPMPTSLLIVTVHPASRPYGAANPQFSDSIQGLRAGDTVTVSLQTNATTMSPVGMYPINATVTGAVAANYQITVNPASLQVTPASLNLTIANVTRYVGVADLGNYTYTVSGLVNNDTITVSTQTATTQWSPAASYPITATVTGSTLTNYDLTVVPGTLQLIPRPPTNHVPPVWLQFPTLQSQQPSTQPHRLIELRNNLYAPDTVLLPLFDLIPFDADSVTPTDPDSGAKLKAVATPATDN